MTNANPYTPAGDWEAHTEQSATIDPQLLLALFGQAPVTFHRLYIDITGSASAAIFLAYALHTVAESEASATDAWWSKSQEQWTAETGLSRREQESARKRLKFLGVLEEQKQQNAPLLYHINAQQLYALMQSCADRGRRS